MTPNLPGQNQHRPQNEYFQKTTWQQFLTGSLPSMASSQDLLLASDGACRVMTPCLDRFQRKEAGLSLIPVPLGPRTELVYTGSDRYKRTSATKIAGVQILALKRCGALAWLAAIAFHTPVITKLRVLEIRVIPCFCTRHAHTATARERSLHRPRLIPPRLVTTVVKKSKKQTPPHQ